MSDSFVRSTLACGRPGQPSLAHACLRMTSNWRRNRFRKESGSSGSVILSGMALAGFSVVGPGG